MRILTKGISEISKNGDKIILTYSEEEDADKAMYELYLDNQDWMNKVYPIGVF